MLPSGMITGIKNKVDTSYGIVDTAMLILRKRDSHKLWKFFHARIHGSNC